MRTFAFILLWLVSVPAVGQRACASFDYQQAQRQDRSVARSMAAVDDYLVKHSSLALSNNTRLATEGSVIRIPVIVHIVYHHDRENISDAQVQSQIDVLNRDFRRRNADTAQTPAAFRHLAADVAIEFVLATADPKGRPTTGILRKYSAISYWQMDDKIKHATSGGSDAWDSQKYLNIWVGNLSKILGYASFPGGKAADDGIVIAYDAFGTINTRHPYNGGRTAAHEVGHWLGLKHIWGDASCGDDGVEDTPKQSNYTIGCPTGIRSSCSSGPAGDMFMNYMDFTNDACLNLFTTGQKQRMHALFAEGGFRNGLLHSRGLDEPWLAAEIDLPFTEELAIYPNPARHEIVLNFEISKDWIGKEIQITTAQGIVVQKIVVTGALQPVNISRLPAGIYFLQGRLPQKTIMEKFIRL